MAKIQGDVPIIACCPPGYHDQNLGSCDEAMVLSTAYSYTPRPKVWFTLNFIHSVVMGRFSDWSLESRDDGFPLMKHADGRDDRTYVWKLTKVRGGPHDFWREGLWPD